MSGSTIPTYIYGVRVDGLANNRQVGVLAASCSILLALTVSCGGWLAFAALMFAAAVLLQWCRAKVHAVHTIERRCHEATCARAQFARAIGAQALHRLSIGQQRPLELVR